MCTCLVPHRDDQARRGTVTQVLLNGRQRLHYGCLVLRYCSDYLDSFTILSPLLYAPIDLDANCHDWSLK